MDYLSTLHLEQEPFSTNPDPAFFYKSSGHISALNHLEIAVRLKRGLSLVLGDVGTGKTTLCRTLIQAFEEESDHFIFHMILDPSFKSENLFYAHLTKIFGISPFFRSTVDYRDAIEKYLFKKCVDEHKTVVLVIDEGQKLKKEHLEILRTLLNYETNDQKLLQLIIFAQLELMPRLEPVRNFVDRITLKYMLRPFDECETGQMIEFRLRKAGYSAASSLFTSDAVKKVYEYTKGYPRQIARVCHNALELLIMEEGQSITADVIEKVIHRDQTLELLMDKNLSAEEKLLNLIRRKKPVRPAGAESDKRDEVSTEHSSLMSQAWRWGSWALMITSVILCGVLFVKFQMGTKEDSSLLETPSQESFSEEKSDFFDKTDQPSDDNYQEMIQARDIFTATVEPKPDAQIAAEQAPPEPKLSEKYKLAGIMLDKDPTAIVEDLQTHQTIILSVGQKIGDAVVEAIQENRVIFRIHDKAVELVR